MKKLLLLTTVLATCSGAMAQEAPKVTSSQKADSTTTLMNEVVVSNPLRGRRAESITVVEREALEDSHRGSVLPTLTEMVPGAVVTQRGMMGYGVSGGAAGGINLRGMQSGSGQVMVMVNCIPQYQGIFGHGLSDTYLSMMAEQVEVVRGPFSTVAGSNAMGGTVNIMTRLLKEDKVESQIGLSAGSWGTLEAEAISMLKKGRLSGNVAAEYGRSDNHRENMGFEQWGGMAELGYELARHWSAFVRGDVTHFKASQPGAVTAPLLEADQWITRGMAVMGLRNAYNNTSGWIKVYDSFGIHKINDGYAAVGGTPQTELFRSKDALAGVNAAQTFFRGNNKLTIGMDYQHIYGRAYYTNRETGEVVTTGRRGMQSTHTHSNEVAVYAEAHKSLLQWLEVDAGIRYDHHSVVGGEWVPKVGITTLPIRKRGNYATLRAMVSKGFRNPTTKDLFLYGSANNELLPERLWNYELAWSHIIGDRLRYDVNIFAMKGDNLIQTMAVDGKQKNVNTGEISNQGIELDVNYKLNNHWSVTTNHSWLHMEHAIMSTPQYKGYVGANVQYGKWSGNVGVLHLNNLITKLDAKGEIDKKETFTLLNASVNYQLHKSLKLWIKGENLLAQRYQYIDGYPMPKATLRAGVGIKF